MKEKKHTKVYYLIHKQNNLRKLYWEFYDNTYLPRPNFSGCQLNRLHVEVHGVNFYIKDQQLIKDGLDGSDIYIYIEDESTYNNAYRANKTFIKRILNKQHLSYYTEQDSDIIDEYGTVPQIGRLSEILEEHKLTEIDISKAYTHALTSQLSIPVFNEFDVFKIYNNEPIEDLTLYKFKVKTNLDIFYQKDKMILYGKYLKHLNNKHYEIEYFKKPSKIEVVDYAQIVDDLYKTELYSDEYKTYLTELYEGDNARVEQEQTHLKKMIVNV